jgi:hypothetical protein
LRLTNYIRDAFVRAALDDVPRIDYDDQMEKKVLAHFVDQLPTKVRFVWDDKALRPYVNTHYYHVHSISLNVPGSEKHSRRLPQALEAELKELSELDTQQTNRRNELKSKLRGVAYACTTRKALVDALPEFEKYLPPEDAPTKNLPMLANVVSDFVKAGWPKGKGKSHAV